MRSRVSESSWGLALYPIWRGREKDECLERLLTHQLHDLFLRFAGEQSEKGNGAATENGTGRPAPEKEGSRGHKGHAPTEVPLSQSEESCPSG